MKKTKNSVLRSSFALIALLFLDVTLNGMIPCDWAACSRQGRRDDMQDAHTYIPKLDSGGPFFAIYDGHGLTGLEAAEYASQNLHLNFVANRSCLGNTIDQSLIKAFEQTDEQMPESSSLYGGTTALVAFIEDSKLYLAWSGDSRALVLRGEKIIFETKDHKPDDSKELLRIVSAGGKIQFSGGTWRIGPLSTSRALGDKKNKQELTPGTLIATPQVKAIDILPKDLILLACDGLYESIMSTEVAQNINLSLIGSLTNTFPKILKQEEHEDKGNNINIICAASRLRDLAYQDESYDNISVMLVRFNQKAKELIEEEEEEEE